MTEICSRPSLLPVYISLGMTLVIIVILTVIRIFFPGLRQNVRPIRFGSAVFGSLLGAGIVGFLLYQNSKDQDWFYGVALRDGKIALDYVWPNKPTTIDASRVTAVKVMRGQHFYKGTRQADNFWVRLVLGPDKVYSCHNRSSDAIESVAKQLAQATGHEVGYGYLCPKSDKSIDITREDAVAPSNAPTPKECAGP